MKNGSNPELQYSVPVHSIKSQMWKVKCDQVTLNVLLLFPSVFTSTAICTCMFELFVQFICLTEYFFFFLEDTKIFWIQHSFKVANKTRVIRFLVIYALVGYLACRQSHFVARIVIVCYFSFFSIFFSSFIICCVLIKKIVSSYLPAGQFFLISFNLT